jgi:hypothetical protein
VLAPCRSGLVLERPLSPARSPRVPPLTMLGLDGPHSFGDGAPNIVKNGTPQIGRALKPFLTVGRLARIIRDVRE